MCGGGGGIIGDITNAVGDVGNTLLGGLGNATGDVGKFIGSAASNPYVEAAAALAAAPFTGGASLAADGVSAADAGLTAGEQALIDSAPADLASSGALSGGASFLGAAGQTALTPELAQTLGITSGDLAGTTGAGVSGLNGGLTTAAGIGQGATGFAPSTSIASAAGGADIGGSGLTAPFDMSGAAAPSVADLAGSATSIAPGANSGGGIAGALKSLGINTPIQGLQTAALGANLFNTLAGGPKLPGAAQTALNSSSQAVQNAQSVISSGGTGTPIWQTQKQQIDTSIQQQLAHATAQLQQNAANTGQSGAVVNQQINALTQQYEQQRQALYLQAQQGNVQSAVAELTGGNQTLSAVAQMQLAGDQQAQSSLSEAAKLAAELASKG
jgi:hypothetical protein